MDIFRFHNPTSPTKLEQGEVINGLTSKMWIEKYRNPGEFKFVGDAGLGLREKLPIGSLISHTDTAEVMIVENHEINDDAGKEPEIIITGRGFETIFEQRIVGSNKTFPTTTADVDFSLAADQTWDQAVTMVQRHISAAFLLNGENAIPFVTTMTDISGPGTSVARTIPKGDLHKRLMELLEVDQLGLKIIRPGPWSPLGGASPNLVVLIHEGVDRTSEVIYSYDTGEIESASYLWSNKKLKNAAFISGRWVQTFISTPDVGYDRRILQVDASDIDQAFTTAPAGGDLTAVVAAMQQRGIDELSAFNEVALTKAEVSKDTNQIAYREDFNVGDLITIHGDYNEISAMRVSEYVEIEDENGSSGYPTLTLLTD